MDAVEIYHFLFETMPGVGILVVICLVVSIILSAIFEVRIRKRYKVRDASPEEDWVEFKDEVEAAEEAEEKKLKE